MGENQRQSFMDKIHKINSSIKTLKDMPLPTHDQLKKLKPIPKAGGSKRKLDVKNPQTKKNRTDKPEDETTTKNTFDVLENESDSRAENDSDMEKEPVTDTTTKEQAPPPIVLHKADTIRLHVGTCKDFRTTTKLLEESKIPFHTFALNDEKLLKVVIKGIRTEIPVCYKCAGPHFHYDAVVTGTSYASRAGGNKTTPVATTSVAEEAAQTQANGLNVLLKLITRPKLDKTKKLSKIQWPKFQTHLHQLK
ncbi:hypothetical protein CBL_05157 [Carabus blaptoides fortunei]